MTKTAPIPGHIQAIIDERLSLVAEAHRLEKAAKEKRAEAALLSIRIDAELSAHSNEMLKEYLQQERARDLERAQKKSPSKQRDSGQPPAERSSKKDENAAAIMKAVRDGRWEDVTRLSGGRA